MNLVRTSLLIASVSVAAVSAGQAKPTYANVQKILNAQCIGCHGTYGKEGVNLTSYASIIKGGAHGPIVKAKDPKGSVLFQVLRGTGGKKIMPPRSKGIPDADLRLIEAWILAGAKEK